MKTFYLYDEAGLYAGDYEAQENPLEEGEYIAPTYSTEEAPPIEKQNESAIYVDGSWQIAHNFQDVEYWLTDGTKHTITEIGIVPPVDAVFAEQEPSLEQVNQNQVQAERNQARADLEALDRASLRDAIDYIASKADAPAALKARNLVAIALVEKLK